VLRLAAEASSVVDVGVDGCLGKRGWVVKARCQLGPLGASPLAGRCATTYVVAKSHDAGGALAV
jgi:hypothetical protein